MNTYIYFPLYKHNGSFFKKDFIDLCETACALEDKCREVSEGEGAADSVKWGAQCGTQSQDLETLRWSELKADI